MDSHRRELLRKIMALEFSALELNLYLDTHPNDDRALADFNQVAHELAGLKQEYEHRYGPLFNYGWGPSHDCWRWPDEPWPWEVSW
ncbi:MAG: spore coat protein CotJB [Clostridia bacterium]|jgi:spore coat protein JB|nr:spore coat protein CotJB [Clostridia bacterium]MDH7573232.1 spore coat protein CotJB [Clostridia bacterium]